jgi:hypothetical protein
MLDFSVDGYVAQLVGLARKQLCFYNANDNLELPTNRIQK